MNIRHVKICQDKTSQVWLRLVQTFQSLFKICQYKTCQDNTRQDKTNQVKVLWKFKTPKDLSKLVKSWQNKTKQVQKSLVKTGQDKTYQDLTCNSVGNRFHCEDITPLMGTFYRVTLVDRNCNVRWKIRKDFDHHYIFQVAPSWDGYNAKVGWLLMVKILGVYFVRLVIVSLSKGVQIRLTFLFKIIGY